MERAHQGGCQDFAAGGPITRRRGQKPEGGSTFENTVLDVCSNQGAKREMRGTDFKLGGRALLATPLAAALAHTRIPLMRMTS